MYTVAPRYRRILTVDSAGRQYKEVKRTRLQLYPFERGLDLHITLNYYRSKQITFMSLLYNYFVHFYSFISRRANCDS